MAWRLDDNVIRGEIDNRERGVVRGRIWLDGRAEPVVLELKGNACADLAGCLLTFENPGETCALLPGDAFALLQRGTVGDIMASRKVRVFDVPLDEALEMSEAGRKPPEHIANALYVEWFSEANGRVVIESVAYRIKVTPPAWTLSAEDEEQRKRDAATAWKAFTQQLTDAVESQRHHGPENMEEWDEFDFEKSLRESDAITDKYMELLDKYGDTPESDDLIAKEMGWDSLREQGGSSPGEEDAADEQDVDLDEMDKAAGEATDEPLVPNPATEGVDWIRVKEHGVDDIRHPLQHRCHLASRALWKDCEALGHCHGTDDDLHILITEFQITSAKLAGALNGLAYGRNVHESAFTVACLKRSLSHLHKTQNACEKVAAKKLLPNKIIARVRKDIFSVREEILRLMDEFRGR